MAAAGADDLDVNFALDEDLAAPDSDVESSDDEASAPAAGMTLFSGTAAKRARVALEQEDVAAAKASGGGGGEEGAEDGVEGGAAAAEEAAAKKKAPVSDEKRAKIAAMKAAAKAKRAVRGAEIVPNSAQAIRLLNSRDQAKALWEFCSKYTSVQLSDLELEALKITRKHVAIPHSNSYFANQKQQAKHTHSASGKGRTKSQQLHGEDGVCWPGALRSLLPTWRALGKTVVIKHAPRPKGKKRARDDEEGTASQVRAPSAITDASTVPPGAPFALVVTLAARRAVAVRGGMKPLRWQVAKLFAKHMKVAEQADALAAQAWHVGVGTPARIATLVAQGALSLEHLQLVVLDAAPNPKGYDILSLKESRKEVADFLVAHILPRTAEGKARLALV